MRKQRSDREVKYVGFYDVLRGGRQIRSYSLAAAKKMDFICDMILSCGKDACIISPSHINVRGKARYKETDEYIRPGVRLCLPPSCEANNKIKRIARVLRARLWLFNKLISETKKGDKVIVYHNYELAVPLLLARFIRRFEIVLEVEEIYAQVWEISGYKKWKERLLLKYTNDNSLIVSEVLREKLGVTEGIISYGSYSAYEGTIRRRDFSGTVKLVFSGLVDRERGSGFMAVQCMEYLPENYVLYVCGPIASKDKEAFLSEVARVNRALGREACKYCGVLDDNDYEKLLTSSDIALNPQIEGKFGDYVFPSKILTYMSYGLPVVSTKGQSIVKSGLGDIITFADDYTPRSVAEAILTIHEDISDREAERLSALKSRFRDQFARVCE
ncbi:MAG: glycosyltransferase [Oscillospiraceae bacterium]|nr:glycosyltransferase [Oscillospiraceae bacterium]